MKKIQTILADDDYLVLEDLKCLVDWDALGFQLLGTAANGQSALTLMKQNVPDLLITDISMPGMDGFELIEQVRTKYPDTYIVLISSYADFHYAKRAMKNGVTEYILKNEITAESLESQLAEIRKTIMELSEHKGLTVRTQLQEYLQGSINRLPDEFEKDTWQFFFFARQLPLERLKDHFSNASGYGNELYQALSPLLLKAVRGNLLFTMDELVVLAVPSHVIRPTGAFSVESLRSSFYRQCLAVVPDLLPVSYLDKELPFVQFRKRLAALLPCLHFRNTFPDPMQGKLSVTESFTPVSTVFPYQYLESSPINRDCFLEHLDIHLSRLFAAKDIDSILMLYHNLILRLEQLCFGQPPFSSRNLFAGKEDLIAFFTQYADYLLHTTASPASATFSPAVSAACSYMSEHFADASLNVDLISEQTGFSSSRLAYLFKQETGKTINDYLTELRIKEAIHLLENSTLKIYEVAEQTGFRSSQYFSQVFKERTGFKPLRYRMKRSE